MHSSRWPCSSDAPLVMSDEARPSPRRLSLRYTRASDSESSSAAVRLRGAVRMATDPPAGGFGAGWARAHDDQLQRRTRGQERDPFQQLLFSRSSRTAISSACSIAQRCSAQVGEMGSIHSRTGPPSRYDTMTSRPLPTSSRGSSSQFSTPIPRVMIVGAGRCFVVSTGPFAQGLRPPSHDPWLGRGHARFGPTASHYVVLLLPPYTAVRLAQPLGST